MSSQNAVRAVRLSSMTPTGLRSEAKSLRPAGRPVLTSSGSHEATAVRSGASCRKGRSRSTGGRGHKERGHKVNKGQKGQGPSPHANRRGGHGERG